MPMINFNKNAAFQMYREQTAKPVAPPSGNRIIYAKSTGFFQQDSSGSESAVGGEQGPVGPAPASQAIYTFPGALSATSGSIRIYNVMGVTKTISSVFLAVNTAPTGGSIVVDVHKSGTTIFTTQTNRPAILTNAFTGSATTINVASWANGEYLTADIDRSGSTIAGSDLTVHIIYS